MLVLMCTLFIFILELIENSWQWPVELMLRTVLMLVCGAHGPRKIGTRLDKEWSICDQSKGARTVQSITELQSSQPGLSKSSTAQICQCFQWSPWKGWLLMITYFE